MRDFVVDTSDNNTYAQYKHEQRRYNLKSAVHRAPILVSLLAFMIVAPIALVKATNYTKNAATVSVASPHARNTSVIAKAGTNNPAVGQSSSNVTSQPSTQPAKASRPHSITIHTISSAIHQTGVSIAKNGIITHHSALKPVYISTAMISSQSGGVSVSNQPTNVTNNNTGGISPNVGTHHQNTGNHHQGNTTPNNGGGISTGSQNGHNNNHSHTNTGGYSGGISPGNNYGPAGGHTANNISHSGGTSPNTGNNHNNGHANNGSSHNQSGNNHNHSNQGPSQNHTQTGSGVVHGQNINASKPKYIGGPSHFVDYNQGDWGARMVATGCGPTSLAMVVSTLTGRHVTPADMASQLSPRYYIPGSGTTPAAFPYIGQKHSSINVNHISGFGDVNRTLRSGGLVIVHAKPGHFTTAGHYMVIRYVSKDNRYTLADPNNAPGRDSETKTWTADQLRANGIDDLWAFSPNR